ncbi:MAG: hypothetical protein M0033_05765 [Nitrospiraceae bacterium]|nr:hypothetical protein [Nitrospiraceae bacterium]
MNHNTGILADLCVSERKGVPKKTVDSARFIENFGIETDAHAGAGAHRQVSLLASESIGKMRKSGLTLRHGAFAENITTSGLDLLALKPGERIIIGKDILLEITQIGKDCHKKCAIYYTAGYCIMPTEGVFARVLKGGMAKKGDEIIWKRSTR